MNDTTLSYLTEVILMFTAIWLSQQEKVTVEDTIVQRVGRPLADSRYRAIRQDGSKIVLNRSELITEEELQLVKELAGILRQQQSPVRNERYVFIMRQLICKGVPFDTMLKNYMANCQQQSLELSDVS